MTRRQGKTLSMRRNRELAVAAGKCARCLRRKRRPERSECATCARTRAALLHRSISGKVRLTKMASERFLDVDTTFHAFLGLHERIAAQATELAIELYGKRPADQLGYSPAKWDRKRSTLVLRLYKLAGFRVEDQFGEVA